MPQNPTRNRTEEIAKTEAVVAFENRSVFILRYGPDQRPRATGPKNVVDRSSRGSLHLVCSVHQSQKWRGDHDGAVLCNVTLKQKCGLALDGDIQSGFGLANSDVLHTRWDGNFIFGPQCC